MFFKNMIAYRLPKGLSISATDLETQLARFAFHMCGTSDLMTIGWAPVRENGTLVHSVNGQYLVALKHEEKILPSSVVKRFAKERARKIEDEEGRKPGRKEMRDIREQVAQELLPRAFTLEKTTFVWIDPKGWIVVDATSASRAEEALEHLRKSVDGLPVKLLQVTQSPSAAMTGWMAEGEAPTPFTLDQDLELRSAEKATVRYVKHTLEGEEIRQHIADGKVVTRLALTWSDRISFVLTDTLQIKHLSFLDILKEQADGQAENEEEQFDIDVTLMTGELARLLPALVEALGGEVVQTP